VNGVAKLVNQKIANHIGIQEKEFGVQADRSRSGATSPSRFLQPNHSFSERQIEFMADPEKPRHQRVLPAPAQPSLQDTFARERARHVSGKGEAIRPRLTQQHRPDIARPIIDLPNLVNRRQDDLRGRAFDLFERKFCAMPGKTALGGLDPSPLPLQQLRNVPQVVSAWHHHLEPVANGHPKANVPGAQADANVVRDWFAHNESIIGWVAINLKNFALAPVRLSVTGNHRADSQVADPSSVLTGSADQTLPIANRRYSSLKSCATGQWTDRHIQSRAQQFFPLHFRF